MKSELRSVECSFDVAGAGERKTIRLSPWGTVESKSGPYLLDEDGAAEIVSRFEAHGTPLVIDYEHQTLGDEYSSPDGTARAAGWIHRIWAEPGRGLMGDVEWLDSAREMIRAGEYRYLSPVLMIRRDDQRAVELHSAALTNKPAIPRMERLAASTRQIKQENTAMADQPEPTSQTSDQEALLIKLGQVIEKYGLKATAADGPAAVIDALLAKGKGGEGESEAGESEAVASKAVLSLLGLKEGADESAVLVAINSHKQGTELVTAMRAELDALKADASEWAVTELID
ncbi:MAG TPA: phage protease, partial [Acidobacteriota bacterium]|nr:phage protease [Acidobacteriota bacterium]